jgi:hypothetical protein
MPARIPGMSFLAQRLQQVPTAVIDAGLAGIGDGDHDRH